MVIARSLLHQVAVLHAAIDRLSACASDCANAAVADREIVQLAAQDVVRAWVQARRRSLEMERQVWEEAADGLDLAAEALGLNLATLLGPHESIAPRSPRGGEQEVLPEHALAGDTRRPPKVRNRFQERSKTSDMNAQEPRPAIGKASRR